MNNDNGNQAILTQDDDEMGEVDGYDNEASGPEQNAGKWSDIFNASTRTYPFTWKEKLVILPANADKVWPIDMFRLFVIDEVVDLIVLETNRFATQAIASQTVTRK